MISGFAQGKAAVSGIALSAKDDSNFSKAMVSVTLVEIYALLSLSFHFSLLSQFQTLISDNRLTKITKERWNHFEQR